MKFDMESFCKDHGIDYSYEGKQISRGWMGLQDVVNKPSDTEYHLAWNIAGNYLNSWISGGMSLRSYLKTVCPQTPYDTLMEQYGDEYQFIHRLEKRQNATQLDFNFEPLSEVAKQYLRRRNFDPDMLASKYGLRWGGIFGDWAFRIIIPIYFDGRVVSWQGRIIRDSPDIPRYLTLSIEKSLVDPKSVLFNEQNVKGDTAVVVEGPMNTFRWGDGAVASLGTSFTEEQVRRLATYKRVLILFDCEKTAQVKAHRLATRLAALGVPDVQVVDMEFSGDKDIAECNDEEIKEIKKKLDIV